SRPAPARTAAENAFVQLAAADHAEDAPLGPDENRPPGPAADLDRLAHRDVRRGRDDRAAGQPVEAAGSLVADDRQPLAAARRHGRHPARRVEEEGGPRLRL